MAGPDRDELMAALAAVRDPELDESITELGFVAGLAAQGGRVEVDLRLPTYFCAPNFAWIMIADAEAALGAVPDVSEVRVRLVDHFAAEEINTGVHAGHGFGESFPGLADGELEELRQAFRRKALAAREGRLCRVLSRSGATAEELVGWRLGDLPADAETDTYLRRRAELGLDTTADAPFLVDEAGAPVRPERAEAHLRRLRAVGVSIEGNAGFCRGLLATRYGGQPAGPDRRQAAAVRRD
jgi:metal-sulfur cluster biosynthetic enzyme